MTHDVGAHLPLGAQLGDVIPIFGRNDREHAFLAFGRHDLVGRHARFAKRDRRHVDVHAHAAARRRFARGTNQTRTTEVLNTKN